MSKSVVLKQNQGFLSDLPLGTIIPWHRDMQIHPNSGNKYIPQLPAGWVKCDGRKLKDPESPFHGQVIPDLNGEGRFLRGAATSGELQDNQMQSHTHADAGHTHEDEGHGHSIEDPGHGHKAPTWNGQDGPYEVPRYGYSYDYDGAAPTTESTTGIEIEKGSAKILSSKADLGEPVAMDGSSLGERVGNETRPINMSVIWIMKVYSQYTCENSLCSQRNKSFSPSEEFLGHLNRGFCRTLTGPFLRDLLQAGNPSESRDRGGNACVPSNRWLITETPMPAIRVVVG